VSADADAPGFDVTVKHRITDEDVAYLLCSAMEGGIGYWSVIVEYVKPENPVAHMTIGGDARVYPHVDYPLSPDGAVILCDNEEWEGDDPDPEGEKAPRHRLDRAAIARGLQVMAEKYPKHFQDFLDENGDACTGDVFVQCCIFGEIVYG